MYTAEIFFIKKAQSIRDMMQSVFRQTAVTEWAELSLVIAVI